MRVRGLPPKYYEKARYRLPTLLGMKPELMSLRPLCSHLHDADLGDLLKKWYGPADATFPGKYRRAHIFYFGDDGEGVIAAICEKGDRGSCWEYIPTGSTSSNFVSLLSEDQAPSAWYRLLVDLAYKYSEIDPKVNAQEIEKQLRATGKWRDPPSPQKPKFKP